MKFRRPASPVRLAVGDTLDVTIEEETTLHLPGVPVIIQSVVSPLMTEHRIDKDNPALIRIRIERP